MSKPEYLVLGVKVYNFTNKETGEVISGTNVYYIDLLMNDYDSQVKGYVPLKTNCTPKVLEQLKTLPGFYDLDFRHRPGANGKATLVLANAEYITAANWLPSNDLKAV